MNEILSKSLQHASRPSASEFSAAKQRLLDQYLKSHAVSNGNGSGGIKPRRFEQLSPLSFAQKQVWVHSQMTSDMPFYNETLTIYRQGPLDPDVLQKCLLEMMRRHEIWRTTFESRSGEPMQRVHPVPGSFPLSIVDLRQVPEAERKAAAERLATTDAQRPFDLGTGPLVRALLVRMDEEQYRVYMTIHQIIFDAVTAYRVLLPELAGLYEAFASDRLSPFPEPCLQYADFATWQQEQRSAHAWSDHLLYWRQQFSGDLPVLQWPHDHLRPAIETHRGKISRFALEKNLVEGIKKFSRRQEVSDYMVLLAALAALFHRYTEQPDIVLGSFTAGRKATELEPLMGYFVNPLPLRIDLSGNPTFQELLTRVRGIVLDGLTHDALPYAEILKEIQYRADPSRNPLFQVALSQQPKLPALPPGWDLATEEICNGGSKIDLMIVVDNRDDKIFGPITYNPDVYSHSTVDRMIAHWQILLANAIADPDKPIIDLPLMDQAEKSKILVDWNNTQSSYPSTACLPSLIEAQAERTPSAMALACGHDRLNYAELNARANQLARYLRKLGVGPETLVGVCMERGIDMVIALLAVLKAGGAYVPLDPAYPQARLMFMIDDADLRFLITSTTSGSELADFAGALIFVDREQTAISKEIATNLAIEMRPANLAYVIYTSGSTGRPKGVQICHRSLVNLLTAMRVCPGLTAEDRLLAVTTISFDIAALELYLPLIAGACCVLAPPEAVADGHELWRLLDEHEITVMQATPSTWKLLLESGWNGKENFRILCGGEALSQELAGRLVGKASAVWNMYGPTETTVWSAVRQVVSAEDRVLIGRPIANTDMYILDNRLQPVPCGVTGELYIGGDGVARGYLNRPQLNEEKFIPHPYRPGLCLYRTGDWARYHPSGEIECLGRMDSQVKIRGFRIELGEIESVLREHSAVADACVLVREDVADDQRLVAYLILKNALSMHELRNLLKQRLPSYMVPHLVVLEKFPLTPNGKLDKLALPAPTGSESGIEEALRELQGPIEQLLARLWSEMLQVPQVSPYDNFFDLGGHSLLATQMVARLETELGVCIKPRELAFQTLGQFAETCKIRLQAQ